MVLKPVACHPLWALEKKIKERRFESEEFFEENYQCAVVFSHFSQGKVKNGDLPGGETN